jgi:hypothetical protein
MVICSLLLLLVSVLTFAGKPSSNLPVTTSLSDYNAAGVQYLVYSDGGGAYENGVTGVESYLVANGINQITWGDWRLDLSNSTSRQVAVTFSTANAVQSGQPGYTAPANPPYWGTKWAFMHLENQCTFADHDMYTMTPGQTFTCDFLFRFPASSHSPFYRLDMAPHTWPETQQAQVQCNSVSGTDGKCNDWFIDPVPVTNPDGSTSPGQTLARLVTVTGPGNTSYTNEGDFYLTFHIHVTRP